MGKFMKQPVKTVEDTALKTGFVTFNKPGFARKAVQTMNGSQLDGRALQVDAWSKGPEADMKVFVGNISPKTKGWKLKEHFDTVGGVNVAVIHGEDPGKGKGKFKGKY